MNTFQKVIKNVISALIVTLAVCGLALVIEGGIFISQWAQEEHSMPWSKKNKADAEQELDPYAEFTAYKNISKLSVSCVNYDLSITIDPEVSEPMLHYISNTGKVSVGTDDDELIIRQQRSYNLFQMFKNRDVIQSEGSIDLRIPENFAFEKLNLDLGSGDTKLDKISTDQFSLLTGSGDFTTSSMYAKDVTMELDDGLTKFENVNFDTVTMEGGDGKTSFSGTLISGADLHVGDGNLTFLVYANRDYYGISVEQGKGDILIDGENYTDLPLETKGSHFINIDNKKGKCNLTFQPINS